jgi:thioredoxin-dependent peroxiredoxin
MVRAPGPRRRPSGRGVVGVTTRPGVARCAPNRSPGPAENNSFDYPLLSDPFGVVAKKFDARRSWLPALPVKRKTFVIDTDRTVLEVISIEMRLDENADSALAALRWRAAA